MASKIKVDQIEGQSGTTVTLPSGQTLDLSSGSVTLPNNAVDLASAKVTGTLGSSNLPTIPVSKGGTGITSLGSAGQALKVNSAGNGLEYGTAAATIKVDERTSGARTSVSDGGANNAYYQLWEPFTSGSPFVKTRADTSLHVEALLIGHAKNSYPFYGLNFRIRNQTGSSVDITERKGVGYIIGDYHASGSVHWYTNTILTPAQCGNQAASFRLGHGWSSASGNDARPFNTWNPNINDDNRGYQKTSWSRITELLI